MPSNQLFLLFFLTTELKRGNLYTYNILYSCFSVPRMPPSIMCTSLGNLFNVCLDKILVWKKSFFIKCNDNTIIIVN